MFKYCIGLLLFFPANVETTTSLGEITATDVMPPGLAAVAEGTMMVSFSVVVAILSEIDTTRLNQKI